jgi:hypothetical protein
VDTAWALLLHRTVSRLKQQGRHVFVQRLRAEVREIFDMITSSWPRGGTVTEVRQEHCYRRPGWDLVVTGDRLADRCNSDCRTLGLAPRALTVLLGTGALLFGACTSLRNSGTGTAADVGASPLSSARWFRDTAQRFRDEPS